MNKSSITGMNHAPSRETRLKRTIAGAMGISLLTGAALMRIHDNNKSDKKAHEALPACIVPVEPLEGPDALVNRVNRTGGDVSVSELKVLNSAGIVRTSANTPNYNFYDSMGMHAGDSGEFSHVSPQVCEKVGGSIVDITATGHLDNR